MKSEKKEDQSHSFKHPEDPSRVIRLVLLRKHLGKKRQREIHNAARRGISGAALGLVSLAITTLLIICGFYVNAILKDLPRIDQLEAIAGPEGSLYQPSRYYDRTGQVLIPGNNVNRPVPAFIELATLPTTVDARSFTPYLSALMEIADSSGVDKLDTSASTTAATAIAERLISNLLLSGEPRSSIRNIRARLLTAQAIQRYGKTNLIDWYINSADYGHGVLGINSAIAFYFNKSIYQINAGDTLVLAVITMEPAINPIDTPEAFNLSLQNAGAYLLGQGVIDTAVVREAASSLGTINPIAREDVADLPAFYTTAREQLSEAIKSSNPEWGGINIITTMDIEIQNRLECALYDMYANTSEGEGCDQLLAGSSMFLPSATVPDDLQVNFVLVDPTNGQILAMLGDYWPATGQQNYLHPHPGGSLVTPFIYLDGLLQGMTPATLVWDTPTGLDESIIKQYPARYMFQGPMSVRTALSGDHLAPAAKLLDGFDQSSVVALMSSFGLHLYASDGMPYTSGVADSLSFAQAFGVFANNGIKAGAANPEQPGNLGPTSLLRATDGNETILLDWDDPQEQTVINTQLAFLVNDMLTVDKSLAPNIKGSTKTGLSSDGADYWRVVYTPDYVFVLWLGYSDPVGKVALKDLGVDTAFVRILSDYYSADTQFAGWQPPDGITRLEVCIPSGQLPGDACPKTISEYFLAGTEPTETDSLYKRYPIDAETGRLATVFTDPASIIQQVFFNPPAEELAWAREAGYPLAPWEYSVYQPGNISGSTVITAPLNFEDIQGKVEIIGDMISADFVSYRLDLGNGLAPTQWLQIGSTITALPDGKKLGSIDTTKYRNGLYTLRIQVLRSGNAADNSYVVIRINNPLTSE
jgi:membrane peptidoglycan carboxypeptidase